ncbi:hypothetical protein N7456_013474 [Penicillium angulare]|uniref:Uncharacterized protein n=1 Tax=Penicillium angulare TaxID=116970 RepID=A0A9W9EGC9_9EURO|nr:hypothetical protein N7456_013474 [Penicillium angulare]
MRSCDDPILPLYTRSRNERARVPKPIEAGGRLYDVMGVSDEHELVLRDQRAIHQDMRIEQFFGQPVMLDGARWRVVSLDTTPDLLETTLQLIKPNDPSSKCTVASTDITRVQFPSVNGDHTLGPIKHGIVRMAPVASRAEIKIPLRPGDQFEARLHDRELDGPYTIHFSDHNQLIATGVSYYGTKQRVSIRPTEVAPRYASIMSLDFGANFDVDTFLYREDQLRGKANIIATKLHDGLLLDPLLGSLPHDVAPLLTNGADHLAVFERFVRDNAKADENSCSKQSTLGTSRRLTMINLSMSNQGDARGTLDALLDFRRQNPDAEMSIVASKLGPTEFQESPEYLKYLKVLEDNKIHVNMFTTPNGPIRQIIHAKAIVIDHQVLFSTGAVMDTKPINKADFSIELPTQAASIFQQYTDEAIHGDASDERRAELASDLANLGVVINDPVAGLTYISRAQDALIRGATRHLMLNISELVDPAMTQVLIDRAKSGIDVTIQVREVDPTSALLLADAIIRYSNLRVEDTSWWEPRPHFNAIIADNSSAYLGTSYLWPTQCHMVHQGRSLENGVLLRGAATNRLRTQLDELRARAHATEDMPSFADALKTWKLQFSLKNPTAFPKYSICLEAWPSLTS